ncbi:MAG TPA: hypothetical protein VHQ86_01740, partial [Candidatus Saccharimonadia bacterium]|nr:hypothetical protein [Candidatus Saccharimonadia bacterium]
LILFLAGVAVMLIIVVVAQSFELRHLTKQQQAAKAAPPQPVVSQITAADLETKLKAAYEAKIDEATKTFGVDLQNTSGRLSEQVSRLTTKVIEEELEAYQKTLEEVRHVATQAMEQIHQAVEHQRVELHQGMEAELAEEKKHLAAKFDDKMGDVVVSYISEALGSGVDLGAQMQFILSSLEAHKDEIRKDLLNGV